MPVACNVVTDATAFYVSLLFLVSHFCFSFVAIRSMLVRTWGNVFCTMSGNALRLMAKVVLVESCEESLSRRVTHRTCHNV
jgi:hypothetical protein